MAPLGVMRPMSPAAVNQRLLSGPDVMPSGALLAGNSVTVPVGVMRLILLLIRSVNHGLPSGPAMMGPRRPLSRRHREFSDGSGGRDGADLSGLLLCEPEIVVRAQRRRDSTPQRR